jgi:hypothetical protein
VETPSATTRLGSTAPPILSTMPAVREPPATVDRPGDEEDGGVWAACGRAPKPRVADTAPTSMPSVLRLRRSERGAGG